MFLCLVSMSADVITVAVGAPDNSKNGLHSSHSRVFAYSSKASKWCNISNDLLGESSHDFFGSSVSIYADGITAAACAPHEDDSGHVRVLTCSFTTIIGLLHLITQEIN